MDYEKQSSNLSFRLMEVRVALEEMDISLGEVKHLFEHMVQESVTLSPADQTQAASLGRMIALLEKRIAKKGLSRETRI